MFKHSKNILFLFGRYLASQKQAQDLMLMNDTYCVHYYVMLLQFTPDKMSCKHNNAFGDIWETEKAFAGEGHLTYLIEILF